MLSLINRKAFITIKTFHGLERKEGKVLGMFIRGFNVIDDNGQVIGWVEKTTTKKNHLPAEFVVFIEKGKTRKTYYPVEKVLIEYLL